MNDYNPKIITPFGFYCQKVLPLVYDQSLSYYEVLCKVSQKLNEVIEAQNSLQDQFVKMQEWVNTQIETYTKEMLEKWKDDGTLENMLLNAVNIVRSFDTCENMKTQNFTNGNIVKTLGYYNVNDGGSALYQVVDTLPTTYYETLPNGLYAKLIFQPIMTFVQFGIKPNVQIDQTEKFNEVFALLEGMNITIDDNNTYYLKPMRTSATESQNYNPKSNTVFKNMTFKLFDNNPNFTAIFSLYSVHDIVFENVTFDQNIANNEQMVVSIELDKMWWWATFYNEDIQDITFRKCVSKHQGIWFLNCSNKPMDTTERVNLYDCEFYRHYKHQSTWYDNTDVFLNALDSHVINCKFQSDSIESQTAIELHNAYSSAEYNTIDGYRCGIIITNLDANMIAMKRDETSISVSHNSITTCGYGISIYPTTDTDMNGIFIHDNFIYCDTLHFSFANGYGIMTNYTLPSVSNNDMIIRNCHIQNNVIDWKPDTYESTDQFAVSVFCGIGLSLNGGWQDCIIDGNTIRNTPGVGISLSADLKTGNTERKDVIGAMIKNNVIDNPLANSNLNVTASATSCYIQIVGNLQNCVVGENVLRYKENKPISQVLVFGSIAGTDTISLLPNYTDDPLNTSWENGTVNTTNATQIKQPALFVDAIGLVHLRGSFTIINNGTTQANIPARYCPPSQTTFGSTTINEDGSITSYAGGGQTVYLDDIVYRPKYYNAINTSRGG